MIARGIAMSALAVALLIGARAEAQGASADAEARAMFERGRAAWDAGDYARAERLWEDAFRLSGRPDLLFNLGNVRLRLGDRVGAADAYRHYLALAPQDDARRAEVDARLEEIGDVELPAAREPGPFDGLAVTWVAGGVTLLGAGVGTGLVVSGSSAADFAQQDAGNALLGVSALALVVTVVGYFVERSVADRDEEPAAGDAAQTPALVRF